MPAGRPKSLDAAVAMPTILHMFWRNGYSGSTLDQIASELGVTKPSLCRTLGDKEAIFAAAIQAYHHDYIKPAERSLGHAESLREALRAVFALFAERTLAADLPDGCFMGDSGSSGEFTTGPIAATLSSLGSQLFGSLHGAVERAIASGELDPAAEPAAVIQYVLGQFAAISAISRSQPHRTELESVVRYMLDGLPWAQRC